MENEFDLYGWNFTKSVAITLSYSDKDILGLDENKLSVFCFDNGKWTSVECQINKKDNLIILETTNLSIYSIMESSPIIQMDKILTPSI